MKLNRGINAVKWTTIDSMLLNFFSLVVFLLLARSLNVHSFGLVNISSFFVLFLSFIISFGFDKAIIQKKEISNKELDSAFIIILFLGVLTSFFLYISSGWISELFEQENLDLVLKLMSSILIFKSISIVPQAVLQREFKFKQLAIRNVIASFISGISAIILAYNGFEHFSLVWQQILTSLIGSVILWKSIKWRPSLNVEITSLLKLFSFARTVFFIEVISLYNKEGIRIFISYFLGPVALGYYAIARRLSNLTINLLTVSLTKVTLPYFSKIQDDIERVKKSFYKITSLSVTIVYPIVFALLVFSQDVIHLILGNKWNESILLFQILICTAFIVSLSYFNGSVLTALGRVNLRLNVSVLRATVGSILFLVAVRISMEWLVLMVLVRAILIEPIIFYFTGKLLKLDWKVYFSNIVYPLLASFVLATLVYFIRQKIDFDEMSLLLQIAYLVGSSMISLFLYSVLLYRYKYESYITLYDYLKGLNIRA